MENLTKEYENCVATEIGIPSNNTAVLWSQSLPTDHGAQTHNSKSRQR